MLMTPTRDIRNSLLPDEAARFLGISTTALGRFRRQGRIKGTRVGTSKLYTYNVDDLRQADIRPRKRGPKGGKTTKK